MGQGSGADLGNGLDGFLNDIARRIAHFMCEQRREAPRDGWIDQGASPLGRKHNGAVRRRLAAGEAGADIVGRRHLLTPDALAEEVRRETRRRTKRGRATDNEHSAVADLDRALAQLGRRAS